mgnify:FL=1
MSPDRPTLEAVELMREHEIGALPVVRENRLVGIITEQDFIQIAGNILDETLGLDGDAEASAASSDSEGVDASS